MNKDQIKGRVKEALGKVEKNAGKANEDPVAEQQGQDRELLGKVQKTFGDVKRKIGKAIDK